MQSPVKDWKKLAITKPNNEIYTFLAKQELQYTWGSKKSAVQQKSS